MADAMIFLAGAGAAAAGMLQEGRLSVQSPGILANQGMFLEEASNRALGDLHALEQNALDTNPAALLPIRNAVAHVVAARALAAVAARAGADGRLGPTYQVALDSALWHLHEAERQMGEVSRAYGSPSVLIPAARTEGQPAPAGQGELK
jgi:hypothetical protein